MIFRVVRPVKTAKRFKVVRELFKPLNPYAFRCPVNASSTHVEIYAAANVPGGAVPKLLFTVNNCMFYARTTEAKFNLLNIPDLIR